MSLAAITNTLFLCLVLSCSTCGHAANARPATNYLRFFRKDASTVSIASAGRHEKVEVESACLQAYAFANCRCSGCADFCQDNACATKCCENYHFR